MEMAGEDSKDCYRVPKAAQASEYCIVVQEFFQARVGVVWDS
jgi:hypothetical protein